LLADVAHCDQPGWPSCYSVGFQDGKAHPGTPCPSGHNADFCSGWNSGAGNTAHCGSAGYPSCYSVGYADGQQHLGASCPNGHTPNYCAGWNTAAGNTAHCDQVGWPSCYDVGYIAGKNAPGSSCPPSHTKAFCNGYATGAGTAPLLDTHCDTPGYPSCYSLGYQAGKTATLGTPCPSGHSVNYCSGWEVGNRSLTPLVNKLSVPDAGYKTAQKTAIEITLTAQDTDTAAKVTISLVSQPTHGSLKSTGSANQYTYTPNLGFSGADSFQYIASDNNGSKSNVGTISITVGSPPLTKLSVSIVVAKNPIVRGNIQTITVTVADDTGGKVAGANVQEEVLYVSDFIHTFPGITDNMGKMIHSWRISGNADPDIFKVTVDATATGYDKGSATASFTVIPKPGA